MSRRAILWLPLLIAAALLSGCGGGERSTDAPPNDLYGTWVQTRLRGGIGGVDQVPTEPERLTFRVDGTATIQVGDATPVTGKFTSKRQQTDVQEQPLLVLTLPNGAKRAILTKSVTSLTLTEFNVSDRQIFDYVQQTD